MVEWFGIFAKVLCFLSQNPYLAKFQPMFFTFWLFFFSFHFENQKQENCQNEHYKNIKKQTLQACRSLILLGQNIVFKVQWVIFNALQPPTLFKLYIFTSLLRLYKNQQSLFCFDMDKNQYILTKTKGISAQQVISFLSNYFVKNEPMMRHIKTQSKIFAKVFGPLLYQCINSDFSYAFLRGQHIIGVLLVLPYLKYVDVWVSKVEPLIEPSIKPIVDLLAAVQSGYQPKDQSKTLQIFIGCTDPGYAKHGLMQRIMLQVQLQGRRQGFNQFIGSCTNTASQNLLKKLNYSQRSKLSYNEFKFNNQRIFKNLQGTQGVILMSKL